MSRLPIESLDLHQPSLEELVPVLDGGLKKNFQNVGVKIVDCPKLNQAPFHLVCEGLAGNTSLADVGGVGNLLPVPKTDLPQYKMADIFKSVGLSSGMMIGAGAGPHHSVGTNCEMAANVGLANGELKTETYVCKTTENSYSLEMIDVGEFALMGNLFCSEGKPGMVLEITASTRTGNDDFITCIRKSLAGEYHDKPVGLGGVFLIENGKAKLHVMPKFSGEPLENEDALNKWLKFYNMKAPLICLGEVVSHDPGMDLRVQHFHCFSMHGDGGHYHYDTTPDTVEYRAYFNVAQRLYRIDRPLEAQDFGKD